MGDPAFISLVVGLCWPALITAAATIIGGMLGRQSAWFPAFAGTWLAVGFLVSQQYAGTMQFPPTTAGSWLACGGVAVSLTAWLLLLPGWGRHVGRALCVLTFLALLLAQAKSKFLYAWQREDVWIAVVALLALSIATPLAFSRAAKIQGKWTTIVAYGLQTALLAVALVAGSSASLATQAGALALAWAGFFLGCLVIHPDRPLAMITQGFLFTSLTLHGFWYADLKLTSMLLIILAPVTGGILAWILDKPEPSRWRRWVPAAASTIQVAIGTIVALAQSTPSGYN